MHRMDQEREENNLQEAILMLHFSVSVLFYAVSKIKFLKNSIGVSVVIYGF